MKNLFLSRHAAGFAAIAALALLRLWNPAPLEISRNYVFDFYQRMHPRAIPEPVVTIVDVDEASLRAYGQWPWPRSLLATLTDRIREAGAAVIGFDMIFPEADRLSPRRLSELVPLNDAELSRRVAALPDNDETFANALGNTRAVLGRAALDEGAGLSAEATRETKPKASVATIGGDPRPRLLTVPGALTSLKLLEAAASGAGMLTVVPERDGIIRRAPLVLRVGNAIEPGMAVELLRVASGGSSIIVKQDDGGVRSVAVGGVEIPSDSDGGLWVAFTPHDKRRYVSAGSVLRGEVPPSRFQGQVVIVGTSAGGLFDLKSTPLDRVIPGVEIHAQIVESILGAATLNRPDFALGLEILLAIIVGSLLVIGAPRVGAVGTLLIGGAIAVLISALSWHLYAAHRLLIDVSYPLASSFAIFLMMTFMNYLREEKRRTQIRAAFRQYLSPELVEQLIREPGRLILGGETREMTILFTDVRGFTSIAESYKANPEGLTALMNRMLTSLSRPIVERRGTIDKYIGDAIMAFWNAPLDDANHALNACEAALEILRRLDDLNKERKQEAAGKGVPVTNMEIGIGIGTGVSVVGNMGSDIRFDYSVLGDNVNLASRLEALTAMYGVRILLGSETARQCAGKLAIIEVDRVRVKGRRDAETIFTLLGGRELAERDDFKLFKSAFHLMLESYRARAWRDARERLKRCREVSIMPQLDKLLAVFDARLAAYELDAPAPEWQGIFEPWAAAV